VPTYQYACTECGHDFETVQSFTDPALTDCPQCSGRLRKVFNSVGIVFKGSGFYRTDSRDTAKVNGSKGSAESASDKPAAKAESNGSAATKTDSSSKPASTGSTAASGSSTKGSAA
jgi:putative FmdB family regulatory protein